jgi:hypothetical protein
VATAKELKINAVRKWAIKRTVATPLSQLSTTMNSPAKQNPVRVRATTHAVGSIISRCRRGAVDAGVTGTTALDELQQLFAVLDGLPPKIGFS